MAVMLNTECVRNSVCRRRIRVIGFYFMGIRMYYLKNVGFIFMLNNFRMNILFAKLECMKYKETSMKIYRTFLCEIYITHKNGNF